MYICKPKPIGTIVEIHNGAYLAAARVCVLCYEIIVGIIICACVCSTADAPAKQIVACHAVIIGSFYNKIKTAFTYALLIVRQQRLR